MADQFDRNEYAVCCEEFKVDQQLCAGAEAEMLGAMRGLISFRAMVPHARVMWDKACINASSNTARLGFPSRSAIAWMTLYQIRQDAYEFATDSASILAADVGVFPWAQTSQEFADNKQALAQGKVPHTGTPDKEDFLAAVKKYRDWAGAVLVFLKNSVGPMKTAAAAIAASNIYIDAGIVLLPPLVSAVSNTLDYINVQNCKAAFEVDSRRRAIIGDVPAIANTAP